MKINVVLANILVYVHINSAVYAYMYDKVVSSWNYQVGRDYDIRM